MDWSVVLFSWVLLRLVYGNNVGYIVGLYEKPQSIVLPNHNGHIVTMTSATGQKLECFLPDPNNPVEELQDETEELVTLDSLSRRLELEFAGMCFQKSTGYWSYEVCPFHSASQFHSTTIISLGEYNPQHPEVEIASGEYRQLYDGGEDGRKTLVRYVCNRAKVTPKTRKRHLITNVQEPQQLNYEITISTDAACNISSGDPARDALLDMLDPFKNKCMYYNRGWWSYKYCHANEVTQFHTENEPIPDTKDEDGNPQLQAVITASFELGKAPADFRSEIVQKDTWDMSYVSQNYTDGTVCDLSGQPRRTHVQLFCQPQEEAVIVYIMEIESCVYEIRIDTMHVCAHPALAPEKPKIAEIKCTPVDDSNS